MEQMKTGVKVLLVIAASHYVLGVVSVAYGAWERAESVFLAALPGASPVAARLVYQAVVAVAAVTALLAQAVVYRPVALMVTRARRDSFSFKRSLTACLLGALPQGAFCVAASLIGGLSAPSALLAPVVVRLGFALLATVIFIVLLVRWSGVSKILGLLCGAILFLLNTTFLFVMSSGWIAWLFPVVYWFFRRLGLVEPPRVVRGRGHSTGGRGGCGRRVLTGDGVRSNRGVKPFWAVIIADEGLRRKPGQSVPGVCDRMSAVTLSGWEILCFSCDMAVQTDGHLLQGGAIPWP
jgi:hypothetical protein